MKMEASLSSTGFEDLMVTIPDLFVASRCKKPVEQAYLGCLDQPLVIGILNTKICTENDNSIAKKTEL